MAELLRISDLPPGSSGLRRVEVLWQEGAARRVAVAEFGDAPGAGDGEQIRWYLEDYAEFPADPAPAIAREAEVRLARAGVELFGRVFGGGVRRLRYFAFKASVTPAAIVEDQWAGQLWSHSWSHSPTSRAVRHAPPRTGSPGRGPF